LITQTKSFKQGENAMPTSRTISANDIEIFLLEQGEGPLVVLCHGWPELFLAASNPGDCGGGLSRCRA
jgi:hypothetical protein